MKKIIIGLLSLAILAISFTSCLSTTSVNKGNPNDTKYNPTDRKTVQQASKTTSSSVKSKIVGATKGSTISLSVTINSNEDYELLKDALLSRDDIKVGLHLLLGENIHTIPRKAFENCHILSFLIVDGPLYTIDEKAFAKCDRLNSVVLPNTVNFIDSSAFLGCLSLNGIIVSEDNISLLKDNEFFVDFYTVSEAAEVLANYKEGMLNLSIYIEDELDTFALLNELSFLPTSLNVRLELGLSSNIRNFSKSAFRKYPNVEIISILGNANIN